MIYPAGLSTGVAPESGAKLRIPKSRISATDQWSRLVAIIQDFVARVSSASALHGKARDEIDHAEQMLDRLIEELNAAVAGPGTVADAASPPVAADLAVEAKPAVPLAA